MRIVTDYKHAQQIIVEQDKRIKELEADVDGLSQQLLDVANDALNAEFMCTECNQNCHGAAQDFCICLDCRKELEADNERLRAAWALGRELESTPDGLDFKYKTLDEALAAQETGDE